MNINKKWTYPSGDVLSLQYYDVSCVHYNHFAGCAFAYIHSLTFILNFYNVLILLNTDLLLNKYYLKNILNLFRKFEKKTKFIPHGMYKDLCCIHIFQSNLLLNMRKIYEISTFVCHLYDILLICNNKNFICV